MNLEVIFVKSDSAFATYISNWAIKSNLQVVVFDPKEHEDLVDGLVVINANQDISKESYEIYTHFDKRNVPTQKVDVNGTLQVALTSFNLWYKGNKCRRIFMIGADNLVTNDNLDRFFAKLDETIFAAS